jgi:hypothetical protein
MDRAYYPVLKQKYESSRGDSTALFETVLSLAEKVGLDEVLACLEQCVTEKRLAWLDQHVATWEKTGHALADGYRLFYESYLGLSVPRHGQIIEATDARWVTRWWNDCPTLDACRKLGLDTREVCRKVYHRPVQLLLSRFDPRLKFERNYDALRPHAAYCEEIITLE